MTAQTKMSIANLMEDYASAGVQMKHITSSNQGTLGPCGGEEVVPCEDGPFDQKAYESSEDKPKIITSQSYYYFDIDEQLVDSYFIIVTCANCLNCFKAICKVVFCEDGSFDLKASTSEDQFKTSCFLGYYYFDTDEELADSFLIIVICNSCCSRFRAIWICGRRVQSVLKLFIHALMVPEVVDSVSVGPDSRVLFGEDWTKWQGKNFSDLRTKGEDENGECEWFIVPRHLQEDSVENMGVISVGDDGEVNE